MRAYDDAAMAAYATDDFARLAEIAGEAEQRKVRALVDRKRRAGLRLEARLEKLHVTSVSRPAPDELLVTATERWRYHERPMRPDLSPGPEYRASIALTYELHRVGGQWKVDEVRASSTVYEGQRPETVHVDGHSAGR